MKQLLKQKKIPTNTNSFDDIYRHWEADPLGPESNAQLIFLKLYLQASILPLKSIAKHKERDICADIWRIFGKAFNDSLLTLETKQASK